MIWGGPCTQWGKKRSGMSRQQRTLMWPSRRRSAARSHSASARWRLGTERALRLGPAPLCCAGLALALPGGPATAAPSHISLPHWA